MFARVAAIRGILSRRVSLALILVTVAALMTGCATLGVNEPMPVTVGQVIQMTKEGTPPEAIIKQMRDSDGVYRLTAAQLAELHDMHVDDRVLNYMQQTYLEAERRDQSLQDWGDWGPSHWWW